MPVFFIIPKNEGQELNYIETFKGDKIDAVRRASEIRIGLQQLLSQGNFTAEVQNMSRRKLKEVGLR